MGKLPWLIKQWKRISNGRPFCLKGIQSVADAKKAVELGVDGIVVSNHAGRQQVDGTVASLDALEMIVNSVGDKTYVWALGIGGQDGVRHIVKGLLAEFEILMNVAEFWTVDEIDRDALQTLQNASNLIAEHS